MSCDCDFLKQKNAAIVYPQKCPFPPESLAIFPCDGKSLAIERFKPQKSRRFAIAIFGALSSSSLLELLSPSEFLPASYNCTYRLQCTERERRRAHQNQTCTPRGSCHSTLIRRGPRRRLHSRGRMWQTCFLAWKLSKFSPFRGAS